jgi:hypothetical protein
VIEQGLFGILLLIIFVSILSVGEFFFQVFFERIFYFFDNNRNYIPHPIKYYLQIYHLGYAAISLLLERKAIQYLIRHSYIFVLPITCAQWGYTSTPKPNWKKKTATLKIWWEIYATQEFAFNIYREALKNKVYRSRIHTVSLSSPPNICTLHTCGRIFIIKNT